MITVDRILSGAAGQPSTLNKPLEHLMACHRRIEDRLATLERAGKHLVVNPNEALAAIDNALAFFRRNGVLHTEDEEKSLFPRLLPELTEEDAAYLAELESQHDRADELHAALEENVAALRQTPVSSELAARYANIVSDLTTLYRAHIATEDSRLFAIAGRKLSCNQLTEIAAEMRQRRQASE